MYCSFIDYRVPRLCNNSRSKEMETPLYSKPIVLKHNKALFPVYTGKNDSRLNQARLASAAILHFNCIAPHISTVEQFHPFLLELPDGELQTNKCNFVQEKCYMIHTRTKWHTANPIGCIANCDKRHYTAVGHIKTGFLQMKDTTV